MNYDPKRILFVMGCLLLVTSYAFSQKSYSLKSHKISVEGTSTLHDWSSPVTKVDWSGQLNVDGKTVRSVQSIVVVIPVESIKSDKGGIMDDKTYEAFNYEKNPNITFKLASATVTGPNIKANGTLTMAGVTKNIVMTAAVKVLADGSISINGSQKLNMKDYKMIPPKAVMGTIKVGEKVTLLFELTLIPQ